MRVSATSRGRRGDRDQHNDSSYPAATLSPPRQAPAVVPVTAPRFQPIVQQASAADHALVQHLLASCGMRLTAGEFQSQLDDPYYLPQQRLLARHNGMLVGHARLLERQWCFGEVVLPVCELADWVVLPEQQVCGADLSLLAAAENKARESGAVLMIARSAATRLLQQHGWIAGPRHTYSTIGARELSAAVRCAPPVRPSLLDDPLDEPLERTVRLWRRIEQDALIRLYNMHCGRAYGAAVRTEEYWNWLLARGAFDRIYVAINGPARLPTEQAADHILGYIVLREEKVVECVAPPAREDILNQLLSRACDDALERDWHPLRIEAPTDHPVHSLIASAGGRTFHHDADEGQALMIKVFDPDDLVRQLSPELLTRARCARLSLPIEIGLATEGPGRRFIVSRRGARMAHGAPGRHAIHCSSQDWLRMLIGRTSVQDLIGDHRLRCHSRSVAQNLQVLLPRLPLWLPNWDVLPALA